MQAHLSFCISWSPLQPGEPGLVKNPMWFYSVERDTGMYVIHTPGSNNDCHWIILTLNMSDQHCPVQMPLITMIRIHIQSLNQAIDGQTLYSTFRTKPCFAVLQKSKVHTHEY